MKKFSESEKSEIIELALSDHATFDNIKYLDPTLILWRSSSQWVGGLYFLIFLILIFSNKTFNYKMTNLTFSGDSNFKSTEKIKDNIIKRYERERIKIEKLFTLGYTTSGDP